MSQSSITPTKSLSEKPVPLQQRLRRRHRELLSAFDEAKIVRTQQNDAAAADRLVQLRSELSNLRMNSETKIVNAQRQCELMLNKLNSCCVSNDPKLMIKNSSSNNIDAVSSASASSTPQPATFSNNNNTNQPAFGPDDRLPQDDIHGNSSSKPENYEEVLSRRQSRITEARLEITQIAVDLRSEHTFRMDKIDSLENALFAFEQERQHETEKLTRELVENIISIAYVNVTQAQSIAQQYLIDENERSLANNVGVTALFSKLRQHELLHFREMMKSMRTVARKTEERCVKSVLVWSMNILLSRRFREPRGRVQLIEKTREMVSQTGRNLKHVVGSITAAAESLPRKPRPTAKTVPLTDIYSIPLPLSESKVPCDIPGGSGDGGWLKHFSLDDPRTSHPFSKRPNEVTAEWTQALETVLDHFGTKSEETILESQQHGKMIDEMVEDILFSMKRDVSHCFTLGPVEYQLKSKQSDEYFPFFEETPIIVNTIATIAQQQEQDENTITNNNNSDQQQVENNNSMVVANKSNNSGNVAGNDQSILEALLPTAEASKDQYAFSLPIFIDNIDRLQGEIKQENKWFTDFISLHLLRQFELANSLINRNGFYSLCTESTAFLQGIVEKICSLVRSAVLWQVESQKDFRDNLTRLETAYQITEDRLSSAGTIEEATELCEQAADLLKKIEQEYVNNFNKSETYLQNIVNSKLPEVFDEEAKQVFSALCVDPIDLKKLQREEDEYVAEVKRQEEEKERELQRRLSPSRNSPKRGGSAAAKSSSTTAATSSPTRAAASSTRGRNDKQRRGSVGDEKAKQELIAERQRILKMANVTSLRGSSYIITAPSEGVMELGGSHEAYLAERIEERALIEESTKKQQQQLAEKPKTPLEVANAAAAAAPSKKSNTRASSKMTKQQKEELERLKLEEVARREQEKAANRLLPVEEKYINFLSREFNNIFTANCLLPPTSLSSYIMMLRSLILDWFEEYRENILSVSKSYTKTTIDQLSLETHECIRRHARRPVTLQSQVFEVRIRQLQDAADARADWFHRLLQRVHRGLEHAQSGVADLEMVEASTSATIEDLKEEVCDANTVAGIDAQSRAFSSLIVDNTNLMRNNLDTIQRRANETFHAVRSEVESFQVHKLKSLEEGGTLTNAEKEVCTQAVRDIYEAIGKAQSDVIELADSAAGRWDATCQSWKKDFDELLDLHRKEVTFLREIGEALTKARGAISVLLSQSNGNHSKLSRAIEALEHFASGSSTSVGEFEVPSRGENFSHLKSVFDFSKMSFSTAISSTTSSTTSSSSSSKTGANNNKRHKIYEESEDSDGTTPIPTDDRIRQPLHQHHVLREKQLCHDSRAAKLANLVLNLREMFCNRGLSLGCLATLPEWGQTAVSEEWLSLESTYKFMQQSMTLLGLSLDDAINEADTNNNNKQGNNNNNTRTSGRGSTSAAGAGKAGASKHSSSMIGGHNNAGGSSSEASIRNSFGGVIYAELSSPDVLLPPMRSTATRLEWLAQRVLDKTEREINRLVTVHFSKPPPGTANSNESNQQADQQQIDQHNNNSNKTSSNKRGGATSDNNNKPSSKNMSKKEKEAAAIAAEIAAQQALAQANKLTRETEFGQDANSIKERASKLLLDQLGRVTDHVQENTNDFRVLVRKLQVSIHGAVEELFNSLLQFQVSSLNESVRIILDDFAFFYKRILEEQRQIQQNLRAPLASPSHAKEWAALCQREATRRRAAKYELQQVAVNFATEIIQSERISNVRVAQALASFFSITKSFILIRHLEGNDSQIPEAGKHRGLRRLLRIKLREELGGPTVVADGADGEDDKNNKKNKNKAGAARGSSPVGGTNKAGAGGGKAGGRRGANNNDDNDGLNNLNNANSQEIPDPIAPPPLNQQAQIPPVALAGLSAGRTTLPAQPQPPSADDIALKEIQTTLASQISINATSNATGAKAQQQRDLIDSLKRKEEALLEKKRQEEDESIAKIIMSVSSQPASWFDDSSKNIFKMIAHASVAQRKEIELQQAIAAGTANLEASTNNRGSNSNARGNNAAAANKNSARSTNSNSNNDNDDTNSNKNETEFFDPTTAFKTPHYAAPSNSPSISQPLFNNSIPYPTPSETRIFPVAYSSAQLTIDKMDSIVNEAAEVLYAKLKQFEEVEQRWVVSWNGAVETLGASGVVNNNNNKNESSKKQITSTAAAAPSSSNGKRLPRGK